ncbi:MAG: PKD domain-containing protein [Phycisphaerales bacterium]|nr:MAG: PKD domain-containing protein [Phycisphaerales bacterium]
MNLCRTESLRFANRMRRGRSAVALLASLLAGVLGWSASAEAACDPGFGVSVRADVLAGKAPLTVVFRGGVIGASADLAEVSWDFDDGGTAGNEKTVRHIYSQAGGYLARFTATNPTNGCSASTTVFIQVNEDVNATPTARMTATFGEGDAPVSVVFASVSEDGDGRIVLHEWSFGDGGFGTGEVVVHNYQQNGAYLVRLTVTDDRGGIDYTIRSIQIGAGVSGLGVTPESAQPNPTNTNLIALGCGGLGMMTLLLTAVGIAALRLTGSRRS